jgi:type IV pilus assembly protein PilN
MYSLDINFLSDRLEYLDGGGGARPRAGDNRPLFVGAGVLGALLALVGVTWAGLFFQKAGLVEEQAKLASQLSELDSQVKDVDALRTQTKQITADNESLASVFNAIKPWSAVLQDLRDRTPDGVQITTINQVEEAAAAPTPAPAATPSPGETPPPPPAPSSSISISGIANNFGEVNDFVLLLQQSPFLQDASTKLMKAELVNNPTQIDLTKASLENGAVVNLPKVVSYTIQTNLSDLSASELIAELNSNGAVGLVNRIETLRTKGVLKQ